MSRIFNASEASGRESGFWSQQRCINDHRFPVKLGCVGRSGRVPWIMDHGTIQYESSLNGITPVKTCVDPRQQSDTMHSGIACGLAVKSKLW